MYSHIMDMSSERDIELWNFAFLSILLGLYIFQAVQLGYAFGYGSKAAGNMGIQLQRGSTGNGWNGWNASWICSRPAIQKPSVKPVHFLKNARCDQCIPNLEYSI